MFQEEIEIETLQRSCSGQLVEIDLSTWVSHGVLGSGAFGSVKIMEHPDTHVMYTVKTSNNDSSILKGFVKECMIYQSKKLHTIIPTFYGSFRNASSTEYYIISEYDSNYKELRATLLSRTYDETERINISKQILDITHMLHEAGIAHLDIKLPNLLIHTTTNNVKIIDFGLSCMKADVTCIVHVSEYKYYPYYYGGFRLGDPIRFITFPDKVAVDFFSVGICIYELLSNTYTNPITLSEYYDTIRKFYFYHSFPSSYYNLVKSYSERITEIQRLFPGEFYHNMFRKKYVNEVVALAPVPNPDVTTVQSTLYNSNEDEAGPYRFMRTNAFDKKGTKKKIKRSGKKQNGSKTCKKNKKSTR